MAAYNDQKVYAELSKLSPDEMFEQLQRITEFVKKAMTEEQAAREDAAAEMQKKINSLNGN